MAEYEKYKTYFQSIGSGVEQQTEHTLQSGLLWKEHHVPQNLSLMQIHLFECRNEVRRENVGA